MSPAVVPAGGGLPAQPDFRTMTPGQFFGDAARTFEVNPGLERLAPAEWSSQGIGTVTFTTVVEKKPARRGKPALTQLEVSNPTRVMTAGPYIDAKSARSVVDPSVRDRFKDANEYLHYRIDGTVTDADIDTLRTAGAHASAVGTKSGKSAPLVAWMFEGTSEAISGAYLVTPYVGQPDRHALFGEQRIPLTLQPFGDPWTTYFSPAPGTHGMLVDTRHHVVFEEELTGPRGTPIKLSQLVDDATAAIRTVAL